MELQIDKNYILNRLNFKFNELLFCFNNKMLDLSDIMDYIKYLFNKEKYTVNIDNIFYLVTQRSNDDYKIIEELNKLAEKENVNVEDLNKKICGAYLFQNYKKLYGDFDDKLDFFDGLWDLSNYLFKDNKEFMKDFIDWDYKNISKNIDNIDKFIKNLGLEIPKVEMDIMNFSGYNRILCE
jgi:hypothetical protein